jgi:hypothetical protein
MTDIDDKRSRKVTLDMEIEDLVEMVSKRKGHFISETPPSQHSIEGEELRKAWFKHMLLSMEKLSDQIQDIRKTDLAQLKTDLKEELRKLEEKVGRNQDKLELYKKEVISPISVKLTTLVAKLGVWSVIAGFIGSGLMAMLVFIIQKYILP